ncbi:MAG TPA: redox-regulated ATPase YchF, partial [Planktothrix sp. UBA8407]|nr:redox-regulated ATPase YchF [Planktothrix sp. UBA8407]
MLTAGIVGLPNVGKSTLFNALVANAKATAANFPFCTIEPNVGVVAVPDDRLNVLAKIVNSQAVVPTRMEFVDIAGLVKGASQGEGLGNQFLSHIREVDAIVHVVRCFENDDIIHVVGSIDPLRDIDIINLELALSDLSQVERRIDRARKQARTNKEIQIEVNGLEKIAVLLNEGKPARQAILTEEELEAVKGLGLVTQKPVIYATNVSEDDLATGNEQVEKVREVAKLDNAQVVVISAQVEAELVDLSEAERTDFLASLGVEEGGLKSLIKATYELLGLRTYLTTGPKETRAWTIKAGMSA